MQHFVWEDQRKVQIKEHIAVGSYLGLVLHIMVCTYIIL